MSEVESEAPLNAWNFVGDAAVSGRSIVWLGGLTDQQKSDILDSTLFAQLAADKKFGGEETDRWYPVYREVLETVGWVVQGSQFTTIESRDTSGSVDDTVISSLANDPDISKETVTAVTKALLAEARADADSRANGVLNDRAISASRMFASFQLVIASYANEELSLKIIAFAYSSSQEIDHALWFKWEHADMEFKTSTLTMWLNEGLYSQVRDSISERLKDRRDVIVGLDGGVVSAGPAEIGNVATDDAHC